MRADRLNLYNRLESQRNSKLLVYVTSTRQGLETQIANDILPKSLRVDGNDTSFTLLQS